MSGVLADPESVPAEVRSYLAELVRRTAEVCGPHLVSVFAVGSIALGDYRHGRSDVDVTVVADPSLPEPAVRDLAAALTDSTCPAAGLELVLYDADFAARPSAAAGFRLNLNTGPLLRYQAAYEASGSPAFWFVIDRAIGYQSGRLLFGRPVREVLAAPSREDQLAAVLESVRDHSRGEGHLADNRVLNGCRAVVFCRTGRWVAKYDAGQEFANAEPSFRPLVDRALRSFERPRSEAFDLPPDEVRAFLDRVRAIVERTARPAGGRGTVTTHDGDPA
ncbi:aminoglycoside adenylyltransferase domain-containing protein [Nocardia vaccinii]|uniref:aminoglycoside adenylyltransferase domain-containing protein n=1 Tax=Nocardia vaccinii TaxID=1822 RepID=UPI000829D284|nr:aminoglycoside adenylyltransferase domain-containing protein [Nocardia vaccinii]